MVANVCGIAESLSDKDYYLEVGFEVGFQRVKKLLAVRGRI